ncbi:hypothetical protein, partial [Streptomyces sp. NPDC006333]|uniref:hypothetical protein n=1 Tax=Streptomyces sp. NPDC006333 TaxID=3156753 RepID=UPI0033B4F7BA
MATAQIPSIDKDEIRVADATDKAITAAWKTRVVEGNGVDPSAADDDINLGFDPAARAAGTDRPVLLVLGENVQSLLAER